MEVQKEILYDFSPRIRVYKDGQIERLLKTHPLPPSFDPTTRVHSKDISISPHLSARIYRPTTTTDTTKLPLLIYIHGGAFCLYSSSSSIYHNYLNSLSSLSPCISLSVDYRLAPEHPMPVCYDDSLEATLWALSHSSGSGPESWLNDFVDFNRVFLAGDSAGANIVHDVVTRMTRSQTESTRMTRSQTESTRSETESTRSETGSSRSENGSTQPETESTRPENGSTLSENGSTQPETESTRPENGSTRTENVSTRFEGAILVHPFFGGEEENPLWDYLYPGTTGLLDPRLNPMADPGRMRKGVVGCERVLVCVGGKDFLREMGVKYYEVLKEGKENGEWKGELEFIESKGRGHVFHLYKPECDEAKELLKRVAHFIGNSKSCGVDQDV